MGGTTKRDPHARRSSVFSNAYTSAALLDGVVIGQNGPYGWSGLAHGTRVIGPRLLRWLCHELGLTQPSRRLVGEMRIPTYSELQEQVDSQLSEGLQMLQDHAHLALGVGDRDSLVRVVRELFGDHAVPPGPRETAEGPLGDAGFKQGQVESLKKAGISVDDALAWCAVGVPAEWVYHVAGLDIDLVRAWLQLGFHPFEAGDLVRAHIPVGAGQPLLDAGCLPRVAATFALKGGGPTEYLAYVDRGVDPELAGTLFENEIPPDEAVRWQELGFNKWGAVSLLRAGGTLAFAEALISEGIAPGGWALTGMSADECKSSFKRGIPPGTSGVLRAAGITPDQAARQWRKGRHRASTIIAKVAEEATSK